MSDDARRFQEIDRWCADRLSAADLDYLRGFQPRLELSLGHARTLLCFHGSPRSFDDIITATTPDNVLDQLFSGHDATVMAGGHTHTQLLRRYGEKILLNPGSVGLNPDGAEYALIQSAEDRLSIELRHLPLPNQEIQQTALESNMPHAKWWADFWK